jgi:hypothetical protein
LNPFKIQGSFNFDFVPEFAILWDFKVGPKSKVAPCVPSYLPAKCGKVSTLGRSPFPVSNIGSLKILENTN